jgi:hypothetical protein
MRAAHCKIGEQAAQTEDASDSEPPQSARYGQNDPEMALGRKNHLFAGSDGGGERWAMVCSLIATAKLNGIEPYAYLQDVLQRMVDGQPINRLDDLLPWNWPPKPVNP